MKDAYNAAISSRRAKHSAVDDSLLAGQPAQHAPQSTPARVDPHGDLAPDVSDHVDAADAELHHDQGSEQGAHLAKPGASTAPQHSLAHSQHASLLEDNLEHREMSTPEHEPLERESMDQDHLGHEHSNQEFEQMMTQGELNEPGRHPKTLAGKVKAAIFAKKGKH